ncbi:hypothetical protein P153DRAFT_380968 [Dothidotthia symphoricarpi CBS 119687]|uniref:Uncharacterized protein n=1 Tax=Dothidotthia symphoricarpi CBS 119687 TaxID=1392245 RepID=A0A6A6APR8_9PLEO|nr:uncharacterized protein P153DRAFT_380968 [Dothidotthia symphoricarpi CBS 119687]KAF2133790.1 hypothetical protein P153DRAFT_380968 [Dothidotthia symphoricarpi CBS 119687]
MPTHTPSPHRFLAPHPPSTQQKPRQKPPSNLRHVQLPTPTPTRHAPLAAQTPTPAKRFVTAQEGRSGSVSGSGNIAPLRSRPRRKLERVESIEEVRSSPSRGCNDRDGVLHSIEQVMQEESDDDAEDEEILFDPSLHKRRRLSSPILPPQTPAQRFRIPPRTHTPLALPLPPSQLPPPTTTSTTTTTQHNRPPLLLPPLPTSPPKPAKPLPQIFSPSRKNARYTPNGLASTVQGWIVETASTGEGRGGMLWGREREDGVRVRVRVTDVGGLEGGAVRCLVGGVVVVRASVDAGLGDVVRVSGSVVDGEQGVGVLLAGQGGARGVASVEVSVGSLVGIRAPTWDVEVGGESWIVGVDWVVL